MTNGLDSSNFEEDELNSNADQVKPRKVAKTMLEQDFLPQSSAPRVAKTMLESELPTSNSGLNAQSRKKVAKTLMDYSVTEAKVLEAAAMQEEEAKNVSARPRIAKTLIEYSLHEELQNPDYKLNEQQGFSESWNTSSNSEPESAPAAVRRPSRNFVAKTMLDHSLLFDALAKSSAKKEQKALEVAKEKANEPVKPFIAITDYKKASACPWSWDEQDGKERFRYCGQCQASIYNFEGLELPEAEALIFKRENREKATLYKRADGKFMTGDCPVQVKQKRDRLSLILIAAAVVIALVAIAVMMPPPPPPPPPAPVPTQRPTSRVPRHSNNGQSRDQSQNNQINQPNGNQSGSGQKNDGSFHWDSSQNSTPASSTAPNSTDTSATAPNANSDDQWQYSNGEGNAIPGHETRPVLPPASAPETPESSQPSESAQSQ